MGFKNKRQLEGKLEKLKVRFIVKRFDFDETFILPVKWRTICIMITLVGQEGWGNKSNGCQNNVFRSWSTWKGSHGTTNWLLWMLKNMICKFCKALRAWYKCVNNF